MATPINRLASTKVRNPFHTYRVTCAGTGTIDAAVATGAAFEQSYAVTPTIVGAVMENFKAPFMVSVDTGNVTITYVHITPDGITAGSAPTVLVTIVGELGTPA